MAAGSLATWLRGGIKGRGHNVRLQSTASGGFTGHVDQSDLGIIVTSAAANAATTTENALTLDHLPYELKIMILRRLDPSSIVAASQTCRSWRAIASDLSLVRRLILTSATDMTTPVALSPSYYVHIFAVPSLHSGARFWSAT